MKIRTEDISGQIFARWTVIERAANTHKGQAQWLCRCACGTERVVGSTRLRKGLTHSCGCLRREVTIARSTKHGHAHSTGVSPTYNTWAGMIARCTDPNHRSFAEYGGAGVTVCERWRIFANFLADMGEKPKGTSLDRYPNQKGNYAPDNCRWANATQQSRNKTNNRMLTFQGETLCLQEWANRLGISQSTLRERLDKWPLEKALSQTKTGQTDYAHCHKLTFQGQTLSLAEWSRVLGLPTHVLYRRFHKGLSTEEVLRFDLVRHPQLRL